MKIWEGQHVFDHPWQSVTAANWRKYPNTYNPNVLSANVIDRSVTPAGTLTTHRIMATLFKIPDWAQKLIGGKQCYVSEVSEADPKNQTLTMRSRNVTFNDLINIEEEIVYKADPTDSQRTIMTQEVRVSVSLYGGSMVESAIIKGAMANAGKGRQAIEAVISSIDTEVRDFAQGIRAATSDLINGVSVPTIHCDNSTTPTASTAK